MEQRSLNKLKATVSTYSLTMEVRRKVRSHTINGNKHIGKECFIASKVEVENSMEEQKIKKVEDQCKEFKPQGELIYLAWIAFDRIEKLSWERPSLHTFKMKYMKFSLNSQTSSLRPRMI